MLMGNSLTFAERQRKRGKLGRYVMGVNEI